MYNAAKTERKHKYTFDSDFRFVVYVYLVASFLSLELGYIHMFSLNHPGDPFFKSRDPTEGHDPGFENHCSNYLCLYVF